MKTKATAILQSGEEISGYLTTEHAASSYGQPVFADEDGQAYNWIEIANVITAAAELGRKGGSVTSEAKAEAARANANKPPKPGKRPRGRPRKDKGETPE